MDNLGAAISILGVVLTIVGIGVVRATLASVFDDLQAGAVERARGLARWRALKAESLRNRVRRRLGRSAKMERAVSDDLGGIGDLIAEPTLVRRFIKDPDKVTEREWLANLDLHVRGLAEENEQLRAALDQQRTDLREELEASSRDGLWLVILGLSLQAAGGLLALIF